MAVTPAGGRVISRAAPVLVKMHLGVGSCILGLGLPMEIGPHRAWN